MGTQLVGVVVGKAEEENSVNRGYIAMLAVETSYRRLNIGKLNEQTRESVTWMSSSRGGHPLLLRATH